MHYLTTNPGTSPEDKIYQRQSLQPWLAWKCSLPSNLIWGLLCCYFWRLHDYPLLRSRSTKLNGKRPLSSSVIQGHSFQQSLFDEILWNKTKKVLAELTMSRTQTLRDWTAGSKTIAKQGEGDLRCGTLSHGLEAAEADVLLRLFLFYGVREPVRGRDWL